METKQYNIGLALSGGGVRGFAHIGALRALEDVGIKPDVIAGVKRWKHCGIILCCWHERR